MLLVILLIVTLIIIIIIIIIETKAEVTLNTKATEVVKTCISPCIWNLHNLLNSNIISDSDEANMTLRKI
jgi:uncharacterized membrane protein YqjE